MNIKSCFLRWGIPLLLLAAFLAAVFALNRVDKVALVNREGQTFEKGVVVDILQDNLMPDGSRVGEQRVLVRMTTTFMPTVQPAPKRKPEALVVSSS